MKYYAIGTKTGKEKQGNDTIATGTKVIFKNLPETRHGAVAEAERRAREQRVTLEGVYPVVKVSDRVGIMSKGIKAQKANAHKKQEAAFKRKLGRAV
jgi:uncharacterized small protein (DUF1192 family)